MVMSTAKVLAELHSIELDDLDAVTTKTTRHLFGLKS